MYPVPPDHRIAYDRNGTVAFVADENFTGIIGQLTLADLQAMNNESSDQPALHGASSYWRGYIFLFPQAYDISGAVAWVSYAYSASLFQVSTDTTNGIDGTWTNITKFAVSGDVSFLRTHITAEASNGIIGLRFAVHSGSGASLYAFHLYGTPSTPNNLKLWDAALDQRVGPALFDFGDVPQSSTHTKIFRVKNLNATQTAYSVALSVETLTDATPSFAAEHTLSTDGTTFTPTVNVGDLAPGAISDTVTLQQALPANAALSLWWARVNADADHWA
jgi:hypothetical protein